MDLDYFVLRAVSKGRALLFSSNLLEFRAQRNAGLVSHYRMSIATTLTKRLWDRYNGNILCAVPVLQLKKMTLACLGLCRVV